ncbi:TetR/AcrR family transcriptional regulator [Tabrizicola sp.]|uniref:TetR/AcrR family transcriptional regulator n=1 Tax=Tabrizicola sp. TaxID=2005166 RepID=UPI0035B0FEBA
MTPDRDQRILEAASEVFTRHGLRAARMEAIAREAGVAKATLYSRYPDKETLFKAVSAAAVASFRAAYAQALDQPGTPSQRVVGAITAKYQAIARLLGDSPHGQEILAEHMRLCPEEHQALTGWFNAEIARMLAAEGRADAEELARVVTAAVDGVKQAFPRVEDFTRILPGVVGKLLA